jgi:hypothetical protein
MLCVIHFLGMRRQFIHSKHSPAPTAIQAPCVVGTVETVEQAQMVVHAQAQIHVITVAETVETVETVETLTADRDKTAETAQALVYHVLTILEHSPAVMDVQSPNNVR